ncbi:ribonuclease R [Castellaniella caeni]|uniref:ribonuclease R n=1 Tax=Castellaniella caeni TaxID=266123 RepID=UPI00082AF65D|nr:ribonuclease R [Castellaniella caeni]
MKKRTNNDNNHDAYSVPTTTLPPDFDPQVPSREQMLDTLRHAGKALSLEALADATQATIPLSTGFIRRVKAMERDGQVRFNAQGRLQICNTTFIAGVVQGHRDGYGFLIPDDGSPDLFLSPHEMAKVLHGDRVRVRPSGEYRGRPEAAIVEVIERRTVKLVGRFLKEHGAFVVAPEDQRIKHDILIPAQDAGGAEPGQVVTVQIVRQPASHVQPMGRVIEVLGEIDDPGMEIEIAVRKFDVPVDFSKATLRQLEAIPDHVREGEYAGRIDLRDVPFITIDGEDARDFDDAVFCTATDLGTPKRARPGWRLLVAIADVSHYVTPGSALDDDAIERGTSVYFPRRVIPMLPEALSNGICSLNPEVDRLVMVCDMMIPAGGTKAGTVVAYQFYEAVIHSHARTTYTDIWAALQQPTGPAAQNLGALYPHVQTAYELFQAFEQARRKRGAIDFDTVETRIVCNPLGRIERIEPYTRNDAHKLIEECMLAANTCAAEFIVRNKRQALFRVHDGPTPQKLQALREALRHLGLTLGGGDDPQTSDYAKLIQESRGRPDFDSIQTMCLRSMQQAIYSPEQTGHFGLSYEHYAHFTSPIRRYPDLLVHRVIRSILHKKRYQPPVLPGQATDPGLPAKIHEQDAWDALGALLSARERRADDASRDVEAWLKCWFVREHVGEVFSGHITGVTSFGVFVTLDTLYVEGLVHISELGSDYFQYNDALNELRGERTGLRYQLGDALQVQVSRVDLEARRIDFRPVRGEDFKSLQAEIQGEPHDAGARPRKKAAGTKPAALRGTTSRQRRAQAKRDSRQETPHKKRS